MMELASLLAADIESYLTDDLCSVDSVSVTFGEPAAPVGEDCRQIWVWVDRVVDTNEFDDDTCSVRSRLTLNYRLYSCYNPDVHRSLDQEETDADCLYGLMEAIWCGLVNDKDTGLLMLLGECKLVSLAPFATDPPQGGTVSATGAVTVDYECPPISA